MSSSLITTIRDELELLLVPLVEAVDDIGARQRFLSALGADDSLASNATLLGALQAAANLRTQIDTVVNAPQPSFAGIDAILQATSSLFAVLRGLDNANERELAGLGTDIIALLSGEYLRTQHPLLYCIGRLMTLVEQSSMLGFSHDRKLVGAPFPYTHIRFDRLSALVNDPPGTLHPVYLPNGLATVADVNAAADALFPRIGAILSELGVIWSYGVPDNDLAMLGDSAQFVDHAFQVYVPTTITGSDIDSGITVTLSSVDHGGLGLVLSPFGTLDFSTKICGWQFDAKLGEEVQALAIGPQGGTLLTSIDTTVTEASFTASLLPKTAGAPAWVFGSATGSRLEFGTAQLGATINISAENVLIAVSAGASSGALVIAAGDGDAFLSSILPAEGMRAEFDLGIVWSNKNGLTLRGSAGLEATLPIRSSIASVTLSAVHLSLQAHESSLAAEISASLSATIGPVQAVLDHVGIASALSFPQTGGNLGVADLNLGFKPPSGIGLSIEAQGVLTGGGFLFHDDAQQLYAGAMQLSLHEQITLKAFGLISTRMPDGSRGYSLVIFITAEGFRPIPLGLGFMLLEIGGMVGVNRTFDQDVLRQGLKNGTLATLLLPRDPVGNAPTLIRSLASAFPAQYGSYLLGLVAKIGWFTPPLVLMDLAFILEFGSRKRLLALGRISALLPSADNDLVRLNMEAMGVIDFDAGTAAIDAVLVDSRLAHKFAITGSAALRAGFGSGPSFVLSVGGFNPHFAPPAGVPALERLAIALSSGKNPRLLCDAYFAITSNTVQFGARASLYASAAGFSVEGDIGFDVLVQLAPLHFIADFHARLQLKRGSHNLFMVSLAGELEGPRPLRVSGKATFHILWFGFSVHFDTTLVHGEPPPLPPAVNVLTQLTQALASPSSWSTQRSATQTHGVALRSLPPASPTAPIVLDPLGQLLVKQQVVPLNTARDIDTFGGAPVAGARRFALTAALDGTPLLREAVQAPFAPAQFFVMSDDEKLAAPSFELMDAGCVFGDANTVFDPAQVIPAPLEYHTISITLQDSSASTGSLSSAPYTISPTQLQSFTHSGAAARAPVRRVGRPRFRNGSVEGAASFNPKRWTIMPNGDGPAATVDPGVRTWSEYHATLKTLNRGGAQWQIVPTHEIEPASGKPGAVQIEA